MQFKTLEKGKAKGPIGERDINSVFNLLAIQCMIRLGEIPDPVSHIARIDLAGARLYYGLLEVLQEKTRGNLNALEEQLLQDLMLNLFQLIRKKSRG